MQGPALTTSRASLAPAAAARAVRGAVAHPAEGGHGSKAHECEARDAARAAQQDQLVGLSQDERQELSGSQDLQGVARRGWHGMAE